MSSTEAKELSEMKAKMDEIQKFMYSMQEESKRKEQKKEEKRKRRKKCKIAREAVDENSDEQSGGRGGAGVASMVDLTDAGGKDSSLTPPPTRKVVVRDPNNSPPSSLVGGGLGVCSAARPDASSYEKSSRHFIHDPKRKAEWSINLPPGTQILVIGDSNLRPVQYVPRGWEVHVFFLEASWNMQNKC